MFRNYLKIAWRNLVRNKAFSAINIVGLAVGLATCLLIGLFVLDELSYDRFNEKADRIVRVWFEGKIQGNSVNEAHVMPPVAATLRANYPDVQEATRLRRMGTPDITYGQKTFRNNDVAFVDANFFHVFTLPLLKGDPKTALTQPNTVIVTQAFAQTYFGNADPMGKVITLKTDNKPYTVTGLIDRVPSNAHFHFDVFASLASLPDASAPDWMRSEYFTYLVLPDGYDYRQLEAKLPQVVEKYISPQLQQAMGMTISQFRQKGNNLSLHLQPLTDIHLHGDFTGDLSPVGDIRYVYLFGAIALFMLLIACINFMNLSTATATKRAREVGVRKVMGSSKWGLVGQFMGESVLLTVVSLLLAVGLVWATLPFFGRLAGKTLSLNFLATPWLLLVVIGFGGLVSLLAGLYPSVVLASFKPVAVLKGAGNLAGTKRGVGLRGGLVVFQFLVSIILMVGATVVYRQLQFIQDKKLGYDKEQVIVLPETGYLGQQEAFFRDQLRQDSRIAHVSASGYLPAGPSNNNNFVVYPDGKSTQVVMTLRYDVDDQYLPAMGMQLVAGRNFSPAFATDSSGAILNQTAAQALGLGRNPLGHTISQNDNRGGVRTYRVIGVVRDFHFRSLRERISPLVMVLDKSPGTLIVKARATDVASLLATMQQQWAALMPDRPFAYSFLNERYQETYVAERRTGQILGFFAGLTIFVACLGLFGLATFTAEQRTKEIGVRKVLGASVLSVVALLSKDFLKLVLVAIVIASPLAWYAMTWWLQDFAYRINIEWWVFTLAGLLAVGIALLTVSFQSVKAALMNPVKSLRSE
ncbi:ABC transporter permease [Fibrella aquatilis]|uniref:ABC transporter permease n=1 Tax=Fibrella aquatilis TaxID=2817059 RepID=A0A939G6B8_9BACT|nr:ABC transporter permease [Fibrella aquatilis]MBO0930846.1 ABC transporter permease [Fibrella aquatilis]